MMKVRKGFFSKTQYEINNGFITKSVYKLFGLKHKKSDDQSISLSKIEYIEMVKLLTLRSNYAIEFISESDSLYIPNLPLKVAEEFIDEAVKQGAKQATHEYMFMPSKKSMKRITKGTTILCDQFGRMVKKVYNQKECSIDSLDASKILYFDSLKEKGIKGIAFGCIAGGGFANSIEIFGLSDDENKKIFEIIKEQNSNIDQADVKLFKSIFPLFHMSRWFKQRESIAITKWGLLHKQYGVEVEGKKYSSRTSVVPFDSVKNYIHSGLIFKQFEIFGSTTITTNESYSRNAKTEIWKNFAKYGITQKSGLVIKPSLFHRRKQGKIILTSDTVFYKFKKDLKVLNLKDVYACTFKRLNWHSIYGDIKMNGRRIDARSGEGGDIVIELNHVSIFKRKKLKKFLSIENDNLN